MFISFVVKNVPSCGVYCVPFSVCAFLSEMNFNVTKLHDTIKITFFFKYSFHFCFLSYIFIFLLCALCFCTVFVLYCLLFHLSCCLFPIYVPVYRPLLPGGNQIAVNKYQYEYQYSCLSTYYDNIAISVYN
jgi:hypothetical protein